MNSLNNEPEGHSMSEHSCCWLHDGYKYGVVTIGPALRFNCPVCNVYDVSQAVLNLDLSYEERLESFRRARKRARPGEVPMVLSTDVPGLTPSALAAANVVPIASADFAHH